MRVDLSVAADGARCGQAHLRVQEQFLASLWELSSYFGLEQGGGNAGSALAHINRMIQVFEFWRSLCTQNFRENASQQSVFRHCVIRSGDFEEDGRVKVEPRLIVAWLHQILSHTP